MLFVQNAYYNVNTSNVIVRYDGVYNVYGGKEMRKLLALVVTATLCFGLVACGGTETPSAATDKTTVEKTESTQTAPETAPETDTEKRLKIGYTFWDLPMAGICIDGANQIKLAAEALGVDVIFNPDTSNLTAEGIVTAVENFAAEGVDGIIVVNFSEASMINIGKTCAEYEIPFIQATRTIEDEAIAKQLEGNEYYVGRVHEDEYAAAYDLGKKLAETGAKNVCLVSSMHGDTAYETRAQAYRDACKDFGMNLVIEQWDLPDDASATETIVNVLNAYPEIDGILTVKCNFVPFIVAAEEAVGITDWLPIAGVDFDITLGENIEKGQITAVAGGHHADATFALITLVNAINGAYDTADYPIDITNNMMTISGIEEYQNYCKWCIGYDEDFYNRQVLNADEIKNLSVVFNPNATVDDIKKAAGSMSLEDVMTRHAGLVE